MTNRLDNYLGHKSNRLMKSLYESAISGAITILNNQIDNLEKEKEKAVEALEEERDALIKPIEDEVEALEDERDAMEKANEQRERAMELTKAQYELERNIAQRTRLIYKNGQMQYVNDSSDVRDAKNNLEDAIYNDKIGKLDDQIDDLNKQIDDINDHYDELIEQTEKFYDNQIEGLQDMVDMWEQLQHKMELVEAISALHEFGLTTEDVLSGNMEAFNMVANGYIGTIAGLTNDLPAVAEAFGTTAENAQSLKEALLGYDVNTQAFSQMASDASVLAEGIDKATSALGGSVGNGTTDVTSEEKSTGTTSEEGTSSGGLIGGLDQLSEKDETVIKPLAESIGGDENSLKSNTEITTTAISGENTDAASAEESNDNLVGAEVMIGKAAEEHVGKAIDVFGELEQKIDGCVSKLSSLVEGFMNLGFDGKVLTDLTNGLPGSNIFTKWATGTAYADGKWDAKSKGISSTSEALVGEEGYEIRVRDGQYEVIGGKGAEFTDIRPDDIIFNHNQSKHLLKNGHINSRGKAYAGGKNNIFSPLSDEETKKYNLLGSVENLAEKLEFGNQKLVNLDKVVTSISNNNTVNNNNPIININNPVFECTGVTGDEVLHQIEQSFSGLFVSAYQKSMSR